MVLFSFKEVNECHKHQICNLMEHAISCFKQACTSGSSRPLKWTTQYLRTKDAMGNELEDPLNMDLSRRGSKDATDEKCLKRKQDPESRQYVRVGTKLDVSYDLLRSQKMEREMPARLEIPTSLASLRIPVNKNQRNEKEHVGQDKGCNYKDVIDLTVGEDRGIRRKEDKHGDASLDEGRNDEQRKRRLLLGMEDCQLMESCPVCNDMFPVHVWDQLQPLIIFDYDVSNVSSTCILSKNGSHVCADVTGSCGGGVGCTGMVCHVLFLSQIGSFILSRILTFSGI